MSLHTKDWLKIAGALGLLATGAGAAGIGPLAGLLGGAGSAGAAGAGTAAGLGAEAGAGATTALASGGLIGMGDALGTAGAASAGGGLASLAGHSIMNAGIGAGMSALAAPSESKMTSIVPGQAPQLDSGQNLAEWFRQLQSQMTSHSKKGGMM